MAEMKCWVCGNTEWIDIDHLRSNPDGMRLCKGCAFITFDRFHDKVEYDSYYDTEYRKEVNVNFNNLTTTNRKIGYHVNFLAPWIKEHKVSSVGEIGSGIGYFLRWCRDNHGIKDLVGSELTTTYRRYAKWAFDITLERDFDYSRKYDLVSCYHTIEHIPNPDDVLFKLRRCINPGGALYMATPIWMEELMKFGGGPFTTFDDHFHRDHINAWSRWHFRKLLAMTGWKIVRDDPKMYGWTVLCEPCEPYEIEPTKRTSDDVLLQLSDMRRAIVAYQKGQFNEAIRLYPQFVDAYLAQAGNVVKDVKEQLKILDIGEANCPNTPLFMIQRALILYQYDRLDDAQKQFEAALQHKPYDDNILLNYGMIFLRRGDAMLKYHKEAEAAAQFKKAVGILDRLIGINPAMYGECFNFIAYMFSRLPLESEASDRMRLVSPHADGAPFVDIAAESTG